MADSLITPEQKRLLVEKGWVIFSDTLWLRQKNGTGITIGTVTFYQPGMAEVTLRCPVEELPSILGLFPSEDEEKFKAVARLFASDRVKSSLDGALWEEEQALLDMFIAMYANDETKKG